MPLPRYRTPRGIRSSALYCIRHLFTTLRGAHTPMEATPLSACLSASSLSCEMDIWHGPRHVTQKCSTRFSLSTARCERILNCSSSSPEDWGACSLRLSNGRALLVILQLRLFGGKARGKRDEQVTYYATTH